MSKRPSSSMKLFIQCLQTSNVPFFARPYFVCLKCSVRYLQTLRDHNYECTVLISHGILPKQVATHDQHRACRIGEAQNPGPDQHQLICAITNPTSIVSKPNQYAALIQKHGLGLFSASETAATAIVQRQFSGQMRRLHFRSLWSVPLPDRVERSDHKPSFRGKASGVGLFSCWPIRAIKNTLDESFVAMSRIGHYLLELGHFQLQIVVIYGHAQSGMDKANLELIKAALKAVDHFPLPFILQGDFNCDPIQLLGDEANHRHLLDLQQIHHRLRGCPMPATCKGITTPDNAVFSPQAAALIRGVEVCPPGDFDTHQVVLYRLALPSDDMPTYHMPMPRTWIDLQIDPKHMQKAYELALTTRDQPATLQAWGETVELAVDWAYRHTQYDLGVPWSQTKPLPKSHRGRCKPRKPEKTTRVLLTKQARPGDFAPFDEIIRRSTQAKVKQVRRVQALHSRLLKAHKTATFDGWTELQLEWFAILRSRAFGKCFVQWCQNTPELGPPPLTCPDMEYLSTMLQLLRHLTTAEIAFDQAIHRDRQKYLQMQDRKYRGNKQAFASVKEPPMPSLVEMRQVCSEEVIAVSNDDGTHTVYCDNPHQFSLACPAKLNETPCQVLEVESMSIQVKLCQPLPDSAETCTLMQETSHANPTAILQMLKDFWVPYWNSNQNIPNSDSQFEQFLQQLPQVLPAPALDMQSTSGWMEAVTRLKVPSARGTDAISSQELQQLPELAIEHLKDIINEMPNGFPPDFMTAITIPVPKVFEIPMAGQVRPITILPQIYRLWARVCAKQLLAHYAQHMPAEVCGFLRGRGAADAYLRQQFHIELCHWRQQHMAGISIDLLKCFNTISQKVVRKAFLWAGIPTELVQQWAHSLRCLSRIWKLGATCTPCIPTSHGVPEGDSWSVVTIVVLAYLWILYTKGQAPTCFMSAYADNWAWGATRPQDHHAILKCTTEYVKLTHMVIDWTKSWAWATTSDQYIALREVLQTWPCAQDLQRRLAAMDLGAQLNYQGSPTLGKFKNRLEKAHARLLRLQHAILPLSIKTQLIKGAVFPAAFYGSEVIPLGESHTRRLRTAMSNAALGPSITRNPALAILAIPGLNDPQLEVILRAVRAMRRFANNLDETERLLLFKMIACHSGLSYKCKGPAGCLAFYLSKLGWRCTSHGEIQVHPALKLPLRTTSAKIFARHAMFAWTQDVMLTCSDRRELRMLQPNVPDTRQTLASFNDIEQHHLAQDLSLSFQTEHQKSRWAQDATGLCLYCGECDSRTHRIFHCAAASDARVPFADTLAWCLEQGTEFAEFPFLLHHPNQELLMHLHYCQPEATIDDNMRYRLEELVRLDSTPIFYTDGSLRYPNSVTCRFGAYAIILDTAISDEQRLDLVKNWKLTQAFPFTLTKLAFARVTGEQTIYRAELYAIVCVTEWTPASVIKTDSASVVATFLKCQITHNFHELGQMEEMDLVWRLWNALRQGNHVIHKIKAHQEVNVGHTPLEIYDILGNRYADETAVSAALHFQPEVAQLATQIHAEVTTEQAHLKQFFRLLLDLRQHFAKLQQNEAATAGQVDLQPSNKPSPQQVMGDWSVQEVWVPPPPGVEFFQYSPWGQPTCQLILQWMQLIQWPAAEQIQEGDPGIS